MRAIVHVFLFVSPNTANPFQVAFYSTGRIAIAYIRQMQKKLDHPDDTMPGNYFDTVIMSHNYGKPNSNSNGNATKCSQGADDSDDQQPTHQHQQTTAAVSAVGGTIYYSIP